jgi:hypothetical protein
MANTVNESATYAAIAASTNVNVGPTGLLGVFVASGTGTVAVYDDVATGTSTPVVAAFTPIAPTFIPLPFICRKGCYVVLTGTLSVTVGFQPL